MLILVKFVTHIARKISNKTNKTCFRQVSWLRYRTDFNLRFKNFWSAWCRACWIWLLGRGNESTKSTEKQVLRVLKSKFLVQKNHMTYQLAVEKNPRLFCFINKASKKSFWPSKEHFLLKTGQNCLWMTFLRAYW